MKSKAILKQIVALLDKAVVADIIIYDMQPITPFYSYSIIATANTSRQGHAAADYLKKAAPNLGLTLRSLNDQADSRWFLVDLSDVVVHIFVGEERQRYNLDGLYFQLEKVEV